MKLKSYLMALAALTFAACQQDDTPAMQEQELRIATRSTSDESATETFTRSFTLELWSTADATEHESHSMTYTDDTGWNTVTSSVLPATAFAYCGEGVSNVTSPTSYTVTLQTDQTNATKLADADVMTATGNATKESSLDLDFAHVFAKVTFNATLASEFDAADYIETFNVTAVDGETVNAYVDGKTVSAIITPGQYTAESVFLSITVSGVEKPLTVKVPSGGFTFNAGKHYTFDLKVGKDKVILTEVSASNDFPGNWYDNDNYSDDVNLNN